MFCKAGVDWKFHETGRKRGQAALLLARLLAVIGVVSLTVMTGSPSARAQACVDVGVGTTRCSIEMNWMAPARRGRLSSEFSGEF